MTSGSERTRGTFVIVGCGDAKTDETREARDLYTSSYFVCKRRFRSDIAEATDREVLPYMPPDFLNVLLKTTRHQTRTLTETVDGTDAEVQQEIAALVTVITDHADHVIGMLDQEDIRPFRSLSMTLNANYAAYIHEAKRIRATHDSILPAATKDSLDEVTDLLRNLDVAREYFKTLFMQEELAYLSRILFYVGIPAEFSSVSILVLFAVTPAGGLPTRGIPFLVPIVVAIGFAPFAVLFAFIVRIATITQHTVPILPFAMPEREP